MSNEPSPRWAHFPATVGDHLYVWGGRTNEYYAKEKNILASSIHCFDPMLESWEHQECSGPTPPVLCRGACISIEGNLYLYGGRDGQDYKSCLYQLNIESRKWQELSSSAGPMRKVGCGIVAYEKKLVVFGGYGYPSLILATQQFVMNPIHRKDGRGWTNELHIFDLEKGVCICMCCHHT